MASYLQIYYYMPHNTLKSSDNGLGVVLMSIECESAIVMPTADSQAFEELGLDMQPDPGQAWMPRRASNEACNNLFSERT